MSLIREATGGLAGLAAVAALQDTAVFAHGPTGAVAEALRHWPIDLVAAGAVALTAVVYTRGVRTLWRRAGHGVGVRTWEAGAFGTGLAVLWLALHSPVAWLSDTLFAAHMAQHELLMIVAAPLLVFGRPLAALLWGLPRRWRAGVIAWTRTRGARQAWTVLTRPLLVFLLHAAVLWIWHLPRLFMAALASDAVHAVQHASFVGTAALFWWGMVHGAYGRLAYGAAVCYVFLTAVHSSLLGALLTLAERPWYSAYVDSARRWQVDPVADQQVAGLVMWVPSGLVFIGLGLALMAAWMAAAGRQAAIAEVTVEGPRP